jgi:hypothetical protein
MTIHINQPSSNFAFFVEYFVRFCGAKQQEHKAHKDKTTRSPQSGYMRRVI